MNSRINPADLWIPLTEIHEELADGPGKANPKAVDWLRRMAAPGKVKVITAQGKKVTVVSRDVLPLVNVYVARRVSTSGARGELSEVCKRLARTTDVFKPISGAAA